METISCNNAGTTPYECHRTGARSTNRSLRLLMSNKAFSLVSGSCKLATRCSIFNAWLFDEDVLSCAAIIIARTNRPIDWKLFSLSARKAFRMMSRTNIDRMRAEEFSSKHKRRSHDSFTTKEYKSVRRRLVLFRRCCCCCCRGKLFVSLSRASQGVFEKGEFRVFRV